MPVVMQLGAPQGHQRRRPGPQVIVHPRGDGLGTVHPPNTAPALVAQAPGDQNLAYLPLLEVLDRFCQSCVGTTLGADLHDPIVLLRRLDQFPPFPNVVRNGLFDVHILAGLTRPDRDQGMPVIGRGDHDGINVCLLQQFAHVDIGVDCFTAGGEFLDFAIQNVLIHIAQGHHPDALQFPEFLDVIGPLASHPHHRHPKILICVEHL